MERNEANEINEIQSGKKLKRKFEKKLKSNKKICRFEVYNII